MKRQEVTIEPAKMVQDLFKSMTYGGHNPMKTNNFLKVVGNTSLVLLPCIWILQVLYLFTRKYENLGEMVMDVVIIGAIWQIFYKSFTTHYKRKEILRLIDMVYEKFWVKNELTEEEHLMSQEIYRYCLIITRSYKISIYFTMFGHCLTATLRGNHNLIMNIWIPEGIREVVLATPYYQLLLLLTFHLMATNTLTGLIPVDNFFMTSLVLIIAQLRILKSKLSTLGKDNVEPEFVIKCVDHHNLIFEAIALVEDIFSASILHLYASDIILGVITLLGLLVERKISMLVELNFVLISVSIQMFAYCLLGQFIQDETLSVADAAYNCKWEDVKNKDIKRTIFMTVQRSQKPARISMGGLLILCLENFTRISRLMLSILTLMINMNID